MSTKIEKIIENMSLDELVGQLMCYNVPISESEDIAEKFGELFERTMPGGIFVHGVTAEQIKTVTELINKHTSVPVIVAGDTEYGPNTIKGSTLLPTTMAWGACDDEKLIERGGKAMAQICRSNGMHWSFAPVVDINYIDMSTIVEKSI